MNLTKKEYKNAGETVYSGELDNGLRVRVIPKPGFSSCYAIFGTNYGGAMRNFEIDGVRKETPAGVAHFLEHKMFDMPSGENALNVFSENGADPNAFTSSSYTCYHFRCTSGFESNLRLLLEFVSTPYFTPETVQKEQGIIGQEIQMGEDSPGSVLYYNLLKCLYAQHPIRDKVAGTIASIAEITSDTLYDCHKIFYAPSNMVLCVEGDVDPERVMEIAGEVLTPEKSCIPHADYGAPESGLPLESRKEVEMPVSSPVFIVGCKNTLAVAESGDKDLRERLVSALSLKLLAGISSKLFSRLYSEGVITNSIDAECDYSAGTSTVMISAEGPDPDRFLKELLDEVQNVEANGFAADYFERTYRATIGSLLRICEDFDELCVNVTLGVLDGFEYLDTYDLMRTVTKEDCEQWIQANLKPERLAMSVIRPVAN